MTYHRQAAILLLLFLSFACGTVPAAENPPTPPEDLQVHPAGPYRVYTDLTGPRLWTAMARLEHLAALYQRQTAGFDGDIDQPLNVLLYSDYNDYRAALDAPLARSAGIYTGGELRAIADTRTFSRESIWHVIQHEGFHQVAHRVIARPGKQLPLWVNEGLAEYFGEALWTGTRLLPGVIDAGRVYSKVPVRGGRCGRIQRRYDEQSFRPIEQLLTLTPEAWREGQLSTIDYDQVYALVHYLIHGEQGAHREAFAAYINEVAKGRPNLPTFKKHFGRDLDAMGEACRNWWMALPDQPTARLHTIIAAETLGNALARAKPGLTWGSADAFLRAVKADGLELLPGRRMHLPNWLVVQAASAAEHLAEWTLSETDARIRLTATLPDGRSVIVDVSPPADDQPGTVTLETRDAPDPTESPVSPTTQDAQ
jgi:hypothetical protein